MPQAAKSNRILSKPPPAATKPPLTRNVSMAPYCSIRGTPAPFVLMPPPTSFGLLSDFLGLLIALYDRVVVRRHESIELPDPGRFRTVPRAVNFGQHSVSRRRNDTALHEAGNR